MTRTDILQRLVAEDGQSTFSRLRELTGWTARRLSRGLEIATGPQGPIRSEKNEQGQRIFRLSRPEERSARRPRGEGKDGVRRLRSSGEGHPRVCAVQPGLHNVWGAGAVVHPGEASDHAAAEGREDEGEPAGLGELGPQRAAAARAGKAGLGQVGA